MKIKNLIPHKWEAWFAPMGEDADYSANDIFKIYFGTYSYAEKKANKDKPDGYELIELVKPFKPKKKRRKISALIQCLYKPCVWLIRNKSNSINFTITCTLIQAIKNILTKNMGPVRITILADPVEMTDPDWVPF